MIGYGAVRVHQALGQRGTKCDRKTASKAMREAGIRSKASRKFRVTTTDSNHPHPVAANVLARDFTADKGVTDVGLAELTKIKIRDDGFSLNLEECQISDSAIAKLAGSTIKTIRLPRSLKPTDAGVKRFLEAPGTSVLVRSERYNRNGLVIPKDRDGPKSGK